MLPELHEMFTDLPAAPSLDPDGARFRLFDSTAAFLRCASEAQPLMLVVDDLHAADTPSLLLLRFLARELRQARIVLCVGLPRYRAESRRRSRSNRGRAAARADRSRSSRSAG